MLSSDSSLEASVEGGQGGPLTQNLEIKSWFSELWNVEFLLISKHLTAGQNCIYLLINLVHI